MTWLWIVAAVLLIAAGAIVPALLSRKRHSANDGDDEAIAARSRYNQLGLHVEVLPPTDDQHTAALLRQARERWVTAGGVLASARDAQEFDLARRICQEGLDLVRRSRS